MPGTFHFKHYLIIFFSFIVMLFILGCASGGGSGGGIPHVPEAGESQTVTAGSVSCDMIYAPGGTFPTGVDDISGDETADAFWIAETEATNGLVAAVYQWAYDNGSMSGGTVSDITVKLHGMELLDLDGSCPIGFSSEQFSADIGYEEYPCVEITWFGAVLFCNWMTEMINGAAGEVVYSGMDDSWEPDETVVDLSKKGFRLLSAVEWECAARYQDGSAWTPGDHASGDTTGPCYPSSSPDLSEVFGDYTWYIGNAGGGIHKVGTTGSATPITACSGYSNALGLYDMSGNVVEINCTGDLMGRKALGGSWDQLDVYLQIGLSINGSAGYSGPQLGFRFARTP